MSSEIWPHQPSAITMASIQRFCLEQQQQQQQQEIIAAEKSCCVGGGEVEKDRKLKLSREKEKEVTKMRERRRRAITSKIMAGLRKHGNYNLPARADVNDVLRALAAEAGWVVERDGTTYRNPILGGGNRGGCSSPLLTTPTSGGSSLMQGGASFGCPPTLPSAIQLTEAASVLDYHLQRARGDCSTTASPRRQQPPPLLSQGGSPAASISLLNQYSINHHHANSAFSSPLGSAFTSPTSSEGAPVPGRGGASIPSSYYFLGDCFTATAALDQDCNWGTVASRIPLGIPTPVLAHHANSVSNGNFSDRGIGMAGALDMPSLLLQGPFLQEARASNHNTPLGSPRGTASNHHDVLFDA